MNEQVKQAQQLCPRCKKPYIGYPAISRVDNETHICSECGLEESIIAMVTIDKKKLQGTFSHQQIKPWFDAVNVDDVVERIRQEAEEKMDTQQLIDRYEEISLAPGFQYTEELGNEALQIIAQLEAQGYRRKFSLSDRKGWIWIKQEEK